MSTKNSVPKDNSLLSKHKGMKHKKDNTSSTSGVKLIDTHQTESDTDTGSIESELLDSISLAEDLFIYLGVLRRFLHCTGHITTGSWKGRGNQYIQFIRVLYCKLPTNSKQLPAFPLEVMTGIEPRPQRWEARVPWQKRK